MVPLRCGPNQTMTRFPTTLLFVVSILMAGLVAIMGHRPPRKSAADSWAEALWMSFPTSGGTSAEMSRLFVAALEKAPRKAPLWVSYGDHESGALKFKEGF